MAQIWTQIKDNLSFFMVCIVVVIAMICIAKLAEHFLPDVRKINKTRRITIIAVCGAIATVLHIFDFPLLFLAPGFYKLDFSELPIMLCGFYLGPTATVLCQAIKILLKLLLKSTSTAFVGDLANFIVGCSLVLPATIIYHAKRTRTSALVGLIVGTVCMTVFGSAFNAVYLIPKFSELFGVPLDAIIGMGTKINPGIHSLSTFVFYSVAPLNLLKGAVISVLTILLYKRVARPLFAR